MDAKDLVSDNARERQTVEHANEFLPHLDGCPPFALVVESIDYSERSHRAKDELAIHSKHRRRNMYTRGSYALTLHPPLHTHLPVAPVHTRFAHNGTLIRAIESRSDNDHDTALIPLVTLAHSWFPRSKKKFSGYLIL